MCSLFSFDPTIIINFIINNFCSIYIYNKNCSYRGPNFIQDPKRRKKKKKKKKKKQQQQQQISRIKNKK